MNTFFILSSFVFFFLSLFLIVYVTLLKKKMIILTNSIEKFIEDGTMTEFSASDGSFSHLQSAVCELEAKLIQEREYTKREAENNIEFISDISHQLKTPLAGLRLYCEMKMSEAPDSHTEKELVLIGKMEKLIYNVLKLEKIRSDTYIMNFEKTDLNELMIDLKSEFNTLYPRKIISLTGFGSLRTDKGWVREAIGNVIKNACEHTAENGNIDISIEQTEKSVSIVIEDNGGGVEEGELHLLFRRFHRTAKASPDSTGIGLSITKAIVEKHHGSITAENSEKGLRISMCFPVIDASLKL